MNNSNARSSQFYFVDQVDEQLLFNDVAQRVESTPLKARLNGDSHRPILVDEVNEITEFTKHPKSTRAS